MIIVDDHLALRALAGDDTYWVGETPSVPRALYFRLLRALRDPTSSGRLSRDAARWMIDYVTDPPTDVLQVIDPRPHTVTADPQARYRLSMAAADMLGSAIHHNTAIHIIEDNIGTNWTEACDIEGIELRVIPR